MKAAAPSPWPLLISTLASGRSGTLTRKELADLGLDADTLLKMKVARRVPVERWQVPGCEHECLPDMDLVTRREEGLVGIACPDQPGCWEGREWHPRDRLEPLSLSPHQLLAAVAKCNRLSPLQLTADRRIVPVGTLERRGLTLPVVWLRTPTPSFSTLLTGLKSELAEDGLVVLLSAPALYKSGTLLADDVLILDVPSSADGDLHLWRALDAFDPTYRRHRLKKWDATFDEVTLEFASIPGERHVLRINGEEFGAFKQSDMKFMRLLYLAAVRANDPDVDRGGWARKALLQDSDPDKALEALRKDLFKYTATGLTHAECKALIKTSRTEKGRIRLALDPKNIVFDQSLLGLRYLGDKQGEGKADTPGARKRAAKMAVSKGYIEAIVERLHALGVPLSSHEEMGLGG